VLVALVVLEFACADGARHHAISPLLFRIHTPLRADGNEANSGFEIRYKRVETLITVNFPNVDRESVSQ
jgi:hypothetical protein